MGQAETEYCKVWNREKHNGPGLLIFKAELSIVVAKVGLGGLFDWGVLVFIWFGGFFPQLGGWGFMFCVIRICVLNSEFCGFL